MDFVTLKANAENYLKSFTNAHGASGYESEVAVLLENKLEKWGEASCDRNGSVAFTQGSGLHVMIAAHMDEVGFRVQRINSKGFISFVPVGGWWGHTLLAQRVSIKTQSGEKILGVIGSKPVHFLTPSAQDKVIDIKDMYIDLGAESKEEVEKLGIRLGDPIVPEAEFTALAQKGRYMAKAFDNRVGCAALPQIAELLPKGVEGTKLSLAATVQEEVGLRGAKTISNVLNPDVAIILEGSPGDDTPGFSADESQATLGGGVQIRLHDPSAIMSPSLVKLATETAEDMGIPYQIAVRTSGGTDAGAFAYSGEGVPCVVLGVPSRYIHTHNSIIDINDYVAMVLLASEMAKRLAE